MNILPSEIVSTRVIESELRNFVALVDYRQIPGSNLPTELYSHSQPYRFVAEKLDRKIFGWEPSGLDLRIKQVWNGFYQALLKNDHSSMNTHLDELRTWSFQNPRGPIEYFDSTDLKVVANDVEPLPNEIRQEELADLFNLCDRFFSLCNIRAVSKSDDYPKLVFQDILMILSRKEGRDLIRSIVSLVEQLNSQGIALKKSDWIKIMNADHHEFLFAKGVGSPSGFLILHDRKGTRFPCETQEMGKLSLYIPRFFPLAHELKHLEHYLKDEEGFHADVKTEPQHPLNSNKEEENAIQFENQLLSAFSMPKRACHWGGINHKLHGIQTQFFMCAQAGLTGDLRRYKGQLSLSDLRNAQQILQITAPQESLDVIEQMIENSPNSRPISPFHTPYGADCSDEKQAATASQ